MSDDKPAAFDKFELFTALLLGFAAIGASVAGFQNGQWGGRQLEAYSAANTLTTKAATQYNEDTVLMNADYAAVAVAKQHVLEARDARDPQARERHMDLASYFYTTQLSENAYKAMELPADLYVEDEDDGTPVAGSGKAPASTTAAPAAAEEDEEEEAPAAAPSLERDIPDDVLVASLGVELDDDYADGMLARGTQMFAEADKKFEEGRVANENGDKFDLAGVFFTVALFFAGLGLVFKTSMRWGFFGAGAAVFAGSCAYLLTLPWA